MELTYLYSFLFDSGSQIRSNSFIYCFTFSSKLINPFINTPCFLLHQATAIEPFGSFHPIILLEGLIMFIAHMHTIFYREKNFVFFVSNLAILFIGKFSIGT